MGRAATPARPATGRSSRRRHRRGARAGGGGDRARDQQRRGVPRADRRPRSRGRPSTPTPTSRCAWTPSWSSSRWPAAGRSSTRHAAAGAAGAQRVPVRAGHVDLGAAVGQHASGRAGQRGERSTAGRWRRRRPGTEDPTEASPSTRARDAAGSPDLGDPTTLLLVRHGETEHTVGLRFSGRGGVDPGLTDAGTGAGGRGRRGTRLAGRRRRRRQLSAAAGAADRRGRRRGARRAGGRRGGSRGVRVRGVGRAHVRRGGGALAGGVPPLAVARRHRSPRR